MELDAKRKVSPRAPAIPLEEAVDRALKLYKAEGRHPSRVEVAIKHVGYTAKSGAALQTMAAMGYWGLLDRPKDGYVVVSKDFEDYFLHPDPKHKFVLLRKFMAAPSLFGSLLGLYKSRLPSDETIKYDLIQRGFNLTAATTCLAVFKKSLAFSNYFAHEAVETREEVVDALVSDELDAVDAPKIAHTKEKVVELEEASTRGLRMPVKLSGGRTAWIEFPEPFFSADRNRLKGFIDLHLANDEEVTE